MKIAVVLKDEKTGLTNPPFFVPSIPDLVRSLEMTTRQDPQSLLAQFPADYSLWDIGQWDEKSGQMTLHQNKEFLFSMANIVKKGVENGEQA